MNRKLILVFILALALEAYFFSLVITGNQTEWWDSAEYLLKAKSMAFGTPSTGWAEHREILPALLWYPFFKFGLGEIGIRIFMAAVGLFGVYIAYLLGRDYFNETVGLLTSFLMSVWYLYYFYMNRLTMYVFAPVIFMSAMYFFWRYYKFKETKKLYFSFLIMGLGIMVYYSSAFAVFVVGLFFLTTDRQFFKNKHIWLAGLVTLLALSPYFIYSQLTFGFPLPRLADTAEAAATQTGAPFLQGILAYPKLIPYMLQPVLFAVFMLALVLSYKLFIGFDMLVKGNLVEERPRLFLFYWILIPMAIYTWTVLKLAGGTVVMPEYIMIIFPAIFMLISDAINRTYEFIAQKQKMVAVVIIALVLISGAYFQLSLADNTFKSKLYSFGEVRDASLYIKDHSEKTDFVVTSSVPQMVYYSERDAIGMSTGGTEDTIEQFAAKVATYKPKYLFWSKYEVYPDWTYNYVMQNNLTVVRGYGTQENPVALLFKFE